MKKITPPPYPITRTSPGNRTAGTPCMTVLPRTPRYKNGDVVLGYDGWALTQCRIVQDSHDLAKSLSRNCLTMNPDIDVS
jgi:hypothetical protein